MLIALYQWGSKYCPPNEPNVRLIMNETGKDADPVFIDRETGLPLDEEHTAFLAGAAASDQLRAVLARRAATSTSAAAQRAS